MSESRDGRANMGKMVEHLRSQGMDSEKAASIARTAQIRKDARDRGERDNRKSYREGE